MKRKMISLQAGENLNRNPNRPVVIVVPADDQSYLWIGNNAKNDRMCFATLSSRRALTNLANSILSALKEQPQ